DVVERADFDAGHSLLGRLQLLSENREPFIVFSPRNRCFVRRQQRSHRPYLLLLLRAGEGITAALEDAVEGVVVAGGDRIELVVMAAGTAECQADERLAEGINRVLNREMVVVFAIKSEPPRDGEIARR